MATPQVPIINIAPLLLPQGDLHKVAQEIKQACTSYGFFYIAGHGIDAQLQADLEAQSKTFFEKERAEKMKIRMALGGKAWRGFFPVGDELTSGKPDLKEGLYFGTELDDDDARVQAGLPMHGQNLFPADMPAFRNTVLNYMDACTNLGHQLMRGISLSLGLTPDAFQDRFTKDPLTLFRIFHYPASQHASFYGQWGVGEHTDYGLLTILKQDPIGGLQVKSSSGWIDAPYIEGTFICNIGDMLDKMTGGYYRSTPHRVLNTSGKSRYSFPFFFDPSFDAKMEAIDLGHIAQDDSAQRWDGANLHAFEGTYGDYVLGKVAKVFPDLS